ncbi:MAG: NAD-binding protein [Desulfobacterales bacterium]
MLEELEMKGPSTRPNVWIIGGGKFGRRAADAFHRKNAGPSITVFETNPEKIRTLENRGIRAVCTDGIAFLAAKMTKDYRPDWIIPAVPVHVAFQWIRCKLSEVYDIVPVAVPEIIRSRLPNPIDGNPGELYVSIADFICPDNCPAPENVCTITRKPRPFDVYSRIEMLKTPELTPVVIQSRQLGPGVGGYTPGALFDALESVGRLDTGILLATACRCHGVIQAFKTKKRDA